VLRRHGWGERSDEPGSHGARDGLGEEVVAGEAAVARPALRVEEADGRPPVRHPVVVLRDADLRPLADDLAAEADPAAAPQLEAEPGTLLQGAPERRGNPGRLEDEEERAGAAGERDEAAEPVRGPGRAGTAATGGRRRARGGPVPRPREIEDEEVGRPCLEERPCHRERLVDGARDENREPFQAHAAGHRLHGVEAPGEVHPGDEGAAGLGLRDRPQGEGRRAAGSVAPEGDRPGPREATGREQRVELGKAGGDAPVDAPRQLAGERPGGRQEGAAGRGLDTAGQGDQRRPDRVREDPRRSGGRLRERGGRPGLRRERGGRPEDLHRGPRRGRSPAGPEAREGGGTVGVAVHRTANTRTSVLHWKGACGPIYGRAGTLGVPSPATGVMLIPLLQQATRCRVRQRPPAKLRPLDS